MKAFLIGCLLLAPLAAVADDSFQVLTRADDAPDDTWQRTSLWRVDPQQRVVWVRANFVLRAESIAPDRPLVLFVAAPVAHEAWWNGVFIGRNGMPGNSASTELPGRIDSSTVIPAALLRAGNNELRLKMSSFHLPLRLGQPIQAIEVREFGAGGGTWSWRNAFRMLSAGALLLGAVYFGALFLSNRKERASLLLALLSLSVLGQLLAESIRYFVSYTYPFHVVRLELILGFAFASALLLVAYVAHHYARAQQLVLLGAMVLLGAAHVVLIPGFDGKTLMVLATALLISGVAAGIGWRRKVRGAGYALLLILGTIALGVGDIYQFIDRSYYLGFVALLFLLFAQQVIALRRAQRERAEAQLRSARLELELLRQQIQPHFLMNTLTALCEWIESDPAEGVKMIEALGDELRAIAVMSESTTVPLAQEIDLCRHHLRVMGYRCNQRFTLTAEGLNLEAPMPPAVFHTLIENAFTHNAHREGAQFVLSAASGANGRRRYELRSPLQRVARAGSGNTGHAYVRARLRDAFGDNWDFSSGPVGDREWLDAVEVPAT